MKCCGPTPALVSTIAGAILCAIGGALYCVLPDIVRDTIFQRLVLSNTSIKFPYFVEPPIPIYVDYYFFNYTNHEEFLNHWPEGVKPRVQEVGPYVYRVHMRKESIQFDESGETVEFYVRNWYEFEPELSRGSLSDKILLPNIPLRAITFAAPKEDNDSVTMLLGAAEPNSFVLESVGDLLFDGYEEELFELIAEFKGIEISPGNKFGLLYMTNDTLTGPIKVSTGKTNIKELGKILRFGNYSTEVHFWEGYCNMINGSDGSMFPPMTSKDEKLYIFNAAGCRSLYLTYKEEVDHYGLKTYRFEYDMEIFADVNMNPDTQCFCKSDINKCMGSGVFNLGQCKMNAQAFISHPHFLYADNHIKSAIDGLSPNHDKHVFHVNVEPITGSPVNVSAKMQTNLAIFRTPWLPAADNMPEIILPLMWFNQHAEANATMAEEAASQLYTAIKLGKLVPTIIMCLGGIVGLLGVIYSHYVMFKGKNQVSSCYKGTTTVKAFAYN